VEERVTCGEDGEREENSGFGVAEMKANPEQEKAPEAFEFGLFPSPVEKQETVGNCGICWCLSISIHHPSSILWETTHDLYTSPHVP
jgi:hypothetical protein